MKKRILFNYLRLGVDFLVFTLALIGVVWAFVLEKKIELFRYFTVESNILCGILSFVLLIFDLKLISSENEKTEKVSFVIRFIASFGVTLTFLTVIFFLGPVFGYGIMYLEYNLLLHLIVPLIALFGFIFFGKNNFKLWIVLLPTLEMIVYGFIYGSCVLTNAWPDFYGFVTKINLFISIPMMLLASFGISIGMYFLNKFAEKCKLKNIT